jgi:hypothetical protein
MMPTTDGNKPVGKSRQRNRKLEQRGQKPDQEQSLKAKQQQSVKPDQEQSVRPDPELSAKPDQEQSARPDLEPSKEPEQQQSATPDLEPSKEPEQQQSATPDLEQDAEEQVVATVTSAVVPTGTLPVVPAASGEPAPVNLQTIATAYGDYTKKSLEQTMSFFEKLTGVRSLDKAIEVQTAFARQTYETFVAQSQKICALHGELAKQMFRPMQGFTVRGNRAAHRNF